MIFIKFKATIFLINFPRFVYNSISSFGDDGSKLKLL